MEKEIAYQYNGEKIKDENIIVSQLSSKKNFTILAYDSYAPNIIIPNINSLIKSDYVICPKCKEVAILEEKEYKLIIYGCQNEHITNNILINEFNKLQEIDHSKIIYAKNVIKVIFIIMNFINVLTAKLIYAQHVNRYMIIIIK